MRARTNPPPSAQDNHLRTNMSDVSGSCDSAGSLALCRSLLLTFPPMQAEYRRALPPSFLFKFFIKTTLDLAAHVDEVGAGRLAVASRQ